MPRTKNTPAIDPAISAAIAQAVAAAIAQTTAQNEVGVVVEAEAKPKPKPRVKRAPKPKPGVITCGTAWEALGADPEYAPKDPSKPATAPQLWRLNSEGLLPALLA
jgi:hypothetical protein